MKISEKISGYQISLLFFTFIVSTLILSVPGIMVAFAKQNAWLSIIFASATGLLNIYVMTALAKRYPGQSIMQYANAICGKWAGKLIGFYCTYYLFFFISSTVNEHAGFLNTILLPQTPPLVIMLTLLIFCCFAVLSGVESIARCNEVIVLIVVVLLLPIFIFSLRDADPARLTPVLAEGLAPVIKGSVVPSAWMSQFFFLGWFLPHLNEKPQQVRGKLLLSLGCIALLIMAIDILTIMIFGPITPRMKFAFLNVIKYTDIVGPLERLEAIAVTIWILGIFIKVCMLLYMFCICTTQLFGAKNYRKNVVPITVLSAVGSVWIFKNDAEFQAWITFSYPILALVTQSLLPLALLAVDAAKRKFAKR
ncbi:GerAB/ArcD/ProY family transporter [Paenibacillus harenae]|uniref:GerAB/ArcD/ProY family transporter n=1 Tax=Paenibacillus harenae TaxID=306543 RepID=UPI000427E3DE|nr:endospore germination permease [Paenibacillus harenae]